MTRRPGVIFLDGDCLDRLAELDADSFDAAITDPPYELGFMGRTWDRSGIAFQVELWAAVLRVLKPGAHLAAFGAARNVHRLTVAIEDAGFEIRDSIDWLFGQGFPKSVDGEREVARALCETPGRHFLRRLPKFERDRREGDHVCEASDRSRQFLGVGSALKPAHEPIVLARKPLSGTIGATLDAFETGGLQVDRARLAGAPPSVPQPSFGSPSGITYAMQTGEGRNGEQSDAEGRWPPNVALSHRPECRNLGPVAVKTNRHNPADRGAGGVATTGHTGQAGLVERGGDETADAWLCVPGCIVADLDNQAGERTSGRYSGRRGSDKFRGIYQGFEGTAAETATEGSTGGASRFFPVFGWTAEDLEAMERLPALPVFRYEGKATRDERDIGCAGLAVKSGAEATASKEGQARLASPRTGAGRTSGARNYHPTVKPLGLMAWLVRLLVQPGGRVVDPFLGSGTTAMACRVEGVGCVGIERQADYLDIARRRVAAVSRPAMLELAERIPDEAAAIHSQADLFGGLADNAELPAIDAGTRAAQDSGSPERGE